MTNPTGPGDPREPAGPSPHAVPDLDAHVFHLGTAEWCWSRLLTTTQGVLSSRGGRRPLRLAVGYSVEDGQVLIPFERAPGGPHLFGGGEVTLGLAGSAADGLRWVVLATGVALRSALATDSLVDCRKSHPARGPEHPQPERLVLDVDRLRGYHEASYDEVGWT